MSREPLTRGILETAKEHAWAVQASRIVVWHDDYGGGYFDVDDTEQNRVRFRGRVEAEVSWDGDVEKKKRPRRRAK